MTAFFSHFDSNFYLAKNPDVAAAIAQGLLSSAEDHFITSGQFENRAPNSVFNPTYYLGQNPDVAAAVKASGLSAYSHFINNGQNELRAPSALFDSAYYLTANPDIAAAVKAGLTSPMAHFLASGQNEGRAIHPAIDLADYLAHNPDVAAAVAAGASAFEHLATNGILEGRVISNNLDLSDFANDPIFNAAIKNELGLSALARVAEVAPFLPNFEAPANYTPPANLPLPLNFVPVDGQKLVVPEGVKVPAGVKLPDTFEPVKPEVKPPVEGEDGGTPAPKASVEIKVGDSTIELEKDGEYFVVEAESVQVDSEFINEFSITAKNADTLKLDISALKANEKGFNGTASKQVESKGVLDLSISTFGNELTIKVAEMDKGNKGDLNKEQPHPKSNQYIKLPSLEDLANKNITIENMTISATWSSAEEPETDAVRNDVIDLTTWVSDSLQLDLVSLIDSITISKTDVGVGEKQNSKYVDLTIEFKDDFTLTLSNIFSEGVYNSIMSYTTAETKLGEAAHSFKNTENNTDIIRLVGDILVGEGTFVIA